jgi:hypothetical protein
MWPVQARVSRDPPNRMILSIYARLFCLQM